MVLQLCLVAILLSVHAVFGQQKPDPEWMNQKFSMFVHWGLYSELGGVWDGKEISSGYSEQIQAFAPVPKEEYEAVARRFNPQKWDAEAVVRLAVMAGMHSIVFTSKHHDGFCMYHSRYTDYNIVEATPFGRDAMKELAEACRKYGIKFGVYFSLIDWHFPGTTMSGHNADPISPEHHEYNLRQVEEIMTNYGPVAEIWFDMGSLTAVQSRELYELVSRLQPQCMVSGRLGNNQGDFCVMGDNQIPDYKIGVPWQTPASFFPETWGYRSWQERGSVERKVSEKLSGLVKVVSRGGNYLLNIGPRGDGSIVEFERDVLLQMGEWMRKYGPAIYNTMASPFEHAMSWGDITRKENKLYLFIRNVPVGREIRLTGVHGDVQGASLMGTCRPVRLDRSEDTLMLYIPATVYPEWGMVVAEITFDGPFRVVSGDAVGDNLLTSENAAPVYAYSSMDYYSSFRSVIARRWYFHSENSFAVPTIVYTEDDKDKYVTLVADGESRDIVLQGGEVRPLEIMPGSVRWKEVYKTEVAENSFGRHCLGEGRMINPLDSSNHGKWEKVYRFGFGEYTIKQMEPRHAVYLLVSVESDKEQSVLLEVSNPEALQVVLNGRTLRKQTSIGVLADDREIVRLPLRKGENQLVVRFYNRYGKKIEYGINPDIPQQVYRLRLRPVPLQPTPIHDFLLRVTKPANKNSGMGLEDVYIEI